MGSSELPSLTALRGIAALFVVIFHLSMFLVPGAHLVDLAPWLGKGYLSVDLFFLLSGFVIAHVYGNRLATMPDARRFLRARIARLYPLHLVTLAAIGLGVLLFPFPSSDPAYRWPQFPLAALMLQNWYDVGCWNYPAWSIGNECVAYVVFVFASRSLLHGRWPVQVALVCAATVVLVCASNGGDLDVYVQLPALLRAIAEFTLGVLLYRAWRGRPAMVRRSARLMLLPALVLALTVPFDAMWLPVFAAALILAVEAKGVLATALNVGPLIWLGNLSYSIYMWHAPVHIALTAVLARLGIDAYTLPPRPALLLVAVALALIFAIASAGYRWVERPARRAINASPRLSGLVRVGGVP